MTTKTMNAGVDVGGAARAKTAPGPAGCVLFGSLSEFRADALSFLARVQKEHGDIARIVLVKPAFVIHDPDGVKRVLQDNHANYRKSFVYDRLKPLLGEGLLTSEGDFWLRQRRLAAPAFHRQRIAAFGELMVKHTGKLLARWERDAADQRAFDVHGDMMALTFAIVGDALFSIDLTDGAKEVGEALTVALDIMNDRFNSMFIAPAALPTPQNRKFASALTVLDGMVKRIIEERRAANVDAPDLLGMLMAAKDEDTGETMTDAQLRDEVMTMVLAGHETTANALSWALYLLSKNPAVRRRVEAEVDEVLGGRLPTMADAAQLPFTTRVLQETLRLYPPAWSFGREAIADDEICGYAVPAGSTVILAPYIAHRHPRHWENPEGFDPDRFLDEEAQKRPRFAYFPFAAGPRMCIGSAFAMMEMQLVLATIAQRWRLNLEHGFEVEVDPSVTLRPGTGGLRMTLQRR